MQNNQDIELGELKQKTYNGFFWEFSSKIFEYIITFIGGLILVRILQPYDYGIIALTYIFVNIASILTEGGFSRYIFQKKDADDLDYSTALIANFSIALVLYIIIFLLAPLISNFYKDDNMISLLRLICLSIVFHSLNITHLTILSLNLNFRFTSLINIISYSLSTIIALFLAINDFGYWSLSALSLTPSIVAVIFLWFFSGIKLKIKFSKSRLIEMIKFGKSMISLELIGTFYSNIYSNLIGKIESTSTVGIYNRAVQTHSYVSMFTRFPLAKIISPVFRKIQDNMELVRDTILRVFELTLYINMPILIFLSIFGDEIFTILYTSKWLPSVWMFQILSIGAIISPFSHTLSYVLISIGQSKLYFRIEWIIKIVQLFVIIIFIFSIKLMLIGLVVFEIIQLIIRLYHFKKYLKFEIKEVFSNLLIYIWLAIIILTVNISVKLFDLQINLYLEMIMIIIINTLIIGLFGYYNKLRPFYDIRDFIMEFMVAIKQKLNF